MTISDKYDNKLVGVSPFNLPYNLSTSSCLTTEFFRVDLLWMEGYVETTTDYDYSVEVRLLSLFVLQSLSSTVGRRLISLCNVLLGG